jgi:hypothetical protein
MDTQAEERVEERTEYPWVAELRAAGIKVRTGTGHLNRVPDASLGPPPGFRWALRSAIRSLLDTWKGKVHRLARRKRHAPVP